MATDDPDTATKEHRAPRERTRGRRRPANKPSEPVALDHSETEAGSDAATAETGDAGPAADPAPDHAHDSGAGPQASPPSKSPGLMKVLWADIRGKRLPRQPTAEELAWEAEEEAAEEEARASHAAGTDLSDEHMERLRRRTTTNIG